MPSIEAGTSSFSSRHIQWPRKTHSAIRSITQRIGSKIAAAVIGGTSLFGGRGRVLGALLGALVIGSVANGLDLLGQSANVKSIITGLILLAAASIDIVSRKRRILSGKGGA